MQAQAAEFSGYAEKQGVRSSERARRVKILEETGAQRVQAAVLGLRGGASEVEAVLTLVRGVRAL